MIIDVEGNLAGPLFFVLNELIVKIIKLRKFFVERHKLLIGQIALNLLMVCLIQEMSLASSVNPQFLNALSVGFFQRKAP